MAAFSGKARGRGRGGNSQAGAGAAPGHAGGGAARPGQDSVSRGAALHSPALCQHARGGPWRNGAGIGAGGTGLQGSSTGKNGPEVWRAMASRQR